ncbi:class I SAM-dependent methyltransferase [Burkholderia mayonis]|uniref:class I SAM-dependent methyltransferase n=1 Tax=Burkholderia mayonis TaxID=1385591 RepID=UPI0009E855AC|nr:class I SAM-dependent methyltransferase [Burkholderia mayonis]
MSKIQRIVRAVVPRHAIVALRLWQVFLRGHGQLKSKDGMPVSGEGTYQPWFTFPLIEYLNGIDFSRSDVFEFGAGASTLYWARRAKSVTSVEFDRGWHKALQTKLPSNAAVYHESDGHRYADFPLSLSRKFDVVVVDGAERYRSALTALKVVSPGGMIILDNAEWYPNTANMLEQAGMIEVRFNGFGPINAFPSTSSAFISRHSTLSSLKHARAPGVGGRALPNGALDDGPI